MNTPIEIIAIDPAGNEDYSREFDSMKEARAWVKSTGLDAKYWDRLAEADGWAARNVESLQLRKGGEIVQEWSTNFGSEVWAKAFQPESSYE